MNIPAPGIRETSTLDVRLLFASRIVRMFAYGLLSVVLVLYLAQIGMKPEQIGLLLTLTLVGDTVISLWLTMHADRVGRRRMLLIGAALMLLAGVAFVLTRNIVLLVLAATIGVISPSGNEVGPFLSIELAALSQIIPEAQRTHLFAWYNLVGSFATAVGALTGGVLVQGLQSAGYPVVAAYRVPLIVYSLAGLALAWLFTRLSQGAEAAERTQDIPAAHTNKSRSGLHHSRGIVFRLSALFALDSFAGGFVIQSIVAYWFYVRYGVQPAALGGIFFGANLLAGLSALAAAKVAARIGLLNTMVVTHIPSNVLLILVPLMPNLPLAIAALLLRFSISQMDVPTRQSYTMAVVTPEERSAAAGVTGTARTVGAALSPALAGALLGQPGWFSAPFYLAGGLKIVHDLLLLWSFKVVPLPEAKNASDH